MTALEVRSILVDGYEVQYRWAPGRDVEVWDVHGDAGWKAREGSADFAHNWNDAEQVAIELAVILGIVPRKDEVQS